MDKESYGGGEKKEGPRVKKKKVESESDAHPDVDLCRP